TRGRQLLLMGEDLLGEKGPASAARPAQNAQAFRPFLDQDLGHIVAEDPDGREALGTEASDHDLRFLWITTRQELGGLTQLDDQPLFGRLQGRESAQSLRILPDEA